MTLSDAILTALGNASSQMPMSFSALQEAVAEIAGLIMPDEFADHLESLCDAAQVRAIRGQRGGIWQNLYWLVTPTAPTAPINATEEYPMSEQKNTLLARLIVLHGPIAGAALAEKARETGANIPAKNVPGLLETLVRKGEVMTRKYLSATWYMTPNQAEEWDEDIRAAGGDRDGHVMSEPETEETRTTDNAEKVSANRILAEKLQHREQDIEKMRTLLASKTETIVHLENQIAVLRESDDQIGRLAMAEFDGNGVIMEINYFEPYVDASGAQQVALNLVNDGGADRVMIIRVIGETKRPPAVFEPMLAPPMQTLREVA